MAIYNNSNLDYWLFLPPEPAKRPIFSDELYTWLILSFSILVFAFSALGVITNAINIRVFIQQGILSDSNTIGLFSLAISDLTNCLFAIPAPICQILLVDGAMAMFLSCSTLTILTASLPHVIMSRVTCWITVYIAVERSLCVLIPFKVKSLIKPKVTATSMILIYTIIIGSYSPIYVSSRMFWQFHPLLNTSVAIYNQGKLGEVSTYYLSYIYNTVLTSIALCVVVITTMLLVYKLKSSRKWRESASGVSKSDSGKDSGDSKRTQTSQGKRELEVMKTVILVTGMFLVCLSMSHIPGFATALIEGATANGYNSNLFYVAYYYKILFDVINSSMNYFFYIRVSSRFKQAFSQVFGGEVKT